MKPSPIRTKQKLSKHKKSLKPAAYQFSVVIEPDDGGFHVFVPALPGCHSFGETVEEARKSIVEAIDLHVGGGDSVGEDGGG
ncbi:MAG: type II toxin-antitoxin system HicB family antitoxin [Chloroflexi bacterium]|nr:type II toxin-antitoxin system HicB family antitoxin [Chloroflexota bacterium]